MQHHMQPPSAKRTKRIRVSLACLPCRDRHVRCDAKQPVCTRCVMDDKECNYTKSRRGGLDRDALAARRSLLSASHESEGETQSPPVEQGETPQTDSTKDSYDDEGGAGASLPVPSSPPSSPNTSVYPASLQQQQQQSQHRSQVSDIPSIATPPEHVPISDKLDIRTDSFIGDLLIDLYYKCFHRLHPCVLPREYMEKLLQDTSQQAMLKPLIAVMRFIGSIFNKSTSKSYPNSIQLELIATDTITEATPEPHCFFLVQCHLLFSIALYWRENPIKSCQHLSSAVEMAINAGMFDRQFAAQHGGDDPVMEESWRRTWWQVYIIDAYHAAINGSRIFQCLTVNLTTEIPCEEDEYESGLIPIPRTLTEFNAREFEFDNRGYSSFAYLIGAVQSISSAISRAHSIATSAVDIDASQRVLEIVDAAIDGWILLLPEGKRSVLSQNGRVDELIFQAIMSLHAATVGLHRPFSEFKFGLLETISAGATAQPGLRQRRSSMLAMVHTSKCIGAAEAQIRLLALPSRPSGHSPFTVCMLTPGTLCLLSACSFLLKDQKLTIARDQIRMSIGYHQAMSAFWPKATTNLQDIRMIAREALALPLNSSETLPVDNGGYNHTNEYTRTTSNSSLEVEIQSLSNNEDTSLCIFLDKPSSFWDVNNVGGFHAWTDTSHQDG